MDPRQPEASVPALCERLETLLGAARVHSDPETCAAFSSDLYSRGIPCAAVVRPADRQQLARAVRAATEAGFAVVPRGGGLTYTGGYTPSRAAAIVVDLGDLNRILAVSATDMYLTAEAGCTWKQIHEALTPQGLRLPCFGTFSGACATVGGGLANGALFFGTARYGTVADSLLGLEVVLADGSLVRTGQGAIRNAARPAYRTFGPDLTGLFVHDAGALGIKAEATFRLIRAPRSTGFASFAFAGIESAVAALSEVARSGAAEEAYVFDPESTRRSLEGVDLRQGIETVARVVRGSASLLQGLGAGARIALSGRRFLDGNTFSLHVTCAAAGAAVLAEELSICRSIAAGCGGREIVDSIPRVARANPFPPLNGVLEPGGARWAALNAKVPHSEALALIGAVDEVLVRYRERMAAARITASRLLVAVSNHAFSIEPVLHWFDEWLPLHRRAPEPSYLRKLAEPPADPAARELVHEIRAELVRLFAARGAASNQIGRTYPYLQSLQPSTRELLLAIKGLVDPRHLLNPGALGIE